MEFDGIEDVKNLSGCWGLLKTKNIIYGIKTGLKIKIKVTIEKGEGKDTKKRGTEEEE